MTSQRSILTSLTIITAALAACTPDAPTGAHSVRLAVVPGAAHGGRPMATPLTQEAWTSGYRGDSDGTGTALLTVNAGRREVCWQLAVQNITLPATAAHIHKALAGDLGAIVVHLSAPDLSGTATGCRSGLDRELLEDILEHPDDYYVNVHNATFPPGAVRGQLEH